MKRVALFGSTGSIGTQALDVIDARRDRFVVAALAAGRCSDAFLRQVDTWNPTSIAIGDPEHAAAFVAARPSLASRLHVGPTGMAAIAGSPDVDIVLNGITGFAGLPVSLAAVDSGKRLALANKESLVTAGPLVMARAAATGAEVIPVDSEHSAIFQCLRSGGVADVETLILTASGGPFRTWDAARIASAGPADALNHPTWKMGPKISVDSATLMNKALEVIEARWIFDVPADRIDVVVHPQSIVHSMVLFKDRSMIAQLGLPTMKVPIQYALTHPERTIADTPTWDVAKFATLNFESPRRDVFPALDLGMWAAREGGLLGTVLNAANEAAVAAFLDGRLSFPDITRRVTRTMERWRNDVPLTLEHVHAADAWAREEAARP